MRLYPPAARRHAARQLSVREAHPARGWQHGSVAAWLHKTDSSLETDPGRQLKLAPVGDLPGSITFS